MIAPRHRARLRRFVDWLFGDVVVRDVKAEQRAVRVAGRVPPGDRCGRCGGSGLTIRFGVISRCHRCEGAGVEPEPAVLARRVREQVGLPEVAIGRAVAHAAGLTPGLDEVAEIARDVAPRAARRSPYDSGSLRDR